MVSVGCTSLESRGIYVTGTRLRVEAVIDSPSVGSCLIRASLEPVQNSFLHREMGDSDGCQGNGDSAKPFPFSANEGGETFATEVITKSFTND